MLSLHESNRLQRVRESGAFRPRTPADHSAMAVYALCGWVRERVAGEWELTNEGHSQLEEIDHE